MSSSLVMTTLLVGMSWPWVAALAMGEADMSGKGGIEEILGTYCMCPRSYASFAPPSTPVVPLRLNCCESTCFYICALFYSLGGRGVRGGRPDG